MMVMAQMRDEMIRNKRLGKLLTESDKEKLYSMTMRDFETTIMIPQFIFSDCPAYKYILEKFGGGSSMKIDDSRSILL